MPNVQTDFNKGKVHSLYHYRHSSSNLTPLSKPSRRVLIVDDDIDLAESIKFLVESYGSVRCEIASEPYEALMMLSDNTYDFVFMDQNLPSIQGDKVLTRIDHLARKDPLIAESGRFKKQIPAVLMSGTDIQLDENYKLKNFSIELLNKRDLTNFLSLNFAS